MVADKNQTNIVSLETLALFPDHECLSSSASRWPNNGLFCKFVKSNGCSLTGNVSYRLDQNQDRDQDQDQKNFRVEEPSFHASGDSFGAGIYGTTIDSLLSCGLYFFMLPQQQSELSVLFFTLPKTNNFFVKTSLKEFVKFRVQAIHPVHLVSLEELNIPKLQVNEKELNLFQRDAFGYLTSPHASWQHIIIPPTIPKYDNCLRALSLTNLVRIFMWPTLQKVNFEQFPDLKQMQEMTTKCFSNIN